MLTKGNWYFYDSHKTGHKWNEYNLGQWASFEIATQLSKKRHDTISIGKISFTAKGGLNKQKYKECVQDMKHIIKSVNMHKQLIKICKLSLEGFEKGESDTIDKVCALIQHAILLDKHYKY